MKRHVIIGGFDPRDSSNVPLGDNEVATRLELYTIKRTLNYGLGKAINDLVQLGIYPTEVGLDLMVLAAHVYAADTRISRKSESQDSWTRELRLVVPVSDRSRWEPTTSTLVRMLNFLTGDRWTICFRQRPSQVATLVPPRTARLIGPPFDNLSLLSGGLDSLINAIDRLEEGCTPLFISHAGDPATSSDQNTLIKGLNEAFPARAFNQLRLWMSFPKGLIPGSCIENSTRARSFLFFALGIFAGSGFDMPFTLYVPENGLIALNVPLDLLRLGALSTRTTHPYYIARWNELLVQLALPGKIDNPYWDQTKGEMVLACANPDLLTHLAPYSMSCSSPTKGRYLGLNRQHCGYCLPCIIRRAALQAGFGHGADKTQYSIPDLKARSLSTQQAEGQQVRAFQLAIERLRLRPELASILIHKQGPLIDESPTRQTALADVYRRGLNEVGSLLSDVKTSP